MQSPIVQPPEILVDTSQNQNLLYSCHNNTIYWKNIGYSAFYASHTV